ncbi:MAG: CAP domain-containing protein [Mesorhizobium amorphae]|nr:MAG: CAP domain-containing protein [Mesorhizobium amorphae]
MIMTRLAVPAAALSAAILSACAPGASPVAGPAPSGCGAASAAEISAVLDATNAFRSARGLPPLRHDPRLSAAAADQACAMAGSGRMSHSGAGHAGPKGRAAARGYGARIIAENVAAGPWTAGQIAAAWAGSPGHAANMGLGPVRDFGLGLARDGSGTVYGAGVYAAPR